jgi:uncharacterized coiled-coil protein SlyX
LAPGREVLTAGELDVLLDRIHTLEQALTSQRHTVAELRQVLARRLGD